LRKNDQIFKAYNEIIQQQLEQDIIEKLLRRRRRRRRLVAILQNHREEGNRKILRSMAMEERRTRITIEGEIALTADIEKAFLQLELQEPDRDACRFLWLRNPGNIGAEIERNLQAYRFCRVPFGATSRPFLLAAVLKTHLKGYPDGSAIDVNLYVDNIFISAENPTEAE
uniref:Reverse transcriptase domain-containing protein n=1 Tax=Toxocara canis TaxID=6265 RepID=A0A183U8J5_TOXCA